MKKFVLAFSLAFSQVLSALGCSDADSTDQSKTSQQHGQLVNGPTVWVLIAEHPNVIPGTEDKICPTLGPMVQQWWIWPASQEATARAFAAQVTGEGIGYVNVFFGTLSELWTMQPGPGPIPSPPADPANP